MSMLCSVSERIHSNLPEEAHVLCQAFKNNLINLNQARPILLNSHYMILLICMWNWAFMEEQKSTAGKGHNGVQ